MGSYYLATPAHHRYDHALFSQLDARSAILIDQTKLQIRCRGRMNQH